MSTLPEPTDDEKLFALLAHLSNFLLVCIAPLIFYVLKKDSAYVKFHALQSIYFNLAGLVLSILTCGVFSLVMIVVNIWWGIRAFQGEWAKIPVVGDPAWPAEIAKVD